MALPRAIPSIDIQDVMQNFIQIYKHSLLEYVEKYLATGEEHLIASIGLRTQWMDATPNEKKELFNFIDELNDRNIKSLSTREAIILGNAYEYGLCVTKNYHRAHEYYMHGFSTINPTVDKAISNRDRGNALANACSLYHSAIDGVMKDHAEALRLAKQAADLGSEFGWGHLGCIYSEYFRDYVKAKEALMKAPSIFFAHGRLSQILDPQNPEDANQQKLHISRAASLGDPMMLQELAEQYRDNVELHAKILGLANTFIGNFRILDGMGLKQDEIEAAQNNLKQYANEHTAAASQLTQQLSLHRLTTILPEEKIASLLQNVTFKLACYEKELTEITTIPKVLFDTIEAFLFEEETVKKAKTTPQWKTLLSFWQTPPVNLKRSSSAEKLEELGEPGPIGLKRSGSF